MLFVDLYNIMLFPMLFIGMVFSVYVIIMGTFLVQQLDHSKKASVIPSEELNSQERSLDFMFNCRNHK